MLPAFLLRRLHIGRDVGFPAAKAAVEDPCRGELSSRAILSVGACSSQGTRIFRRREF